ncbi:MAG: DMT family transporter [Alphaproteobacteria bacterium]|nr:DMT family transporter [Alphaproteobacteria bacterium]
MALFRDDFSRGFSALLLGAAGISCAAIFVRLSDVSPSASAFWRLALATPFLIAFHLIQSRIDLSAPRKEIDKQQLSWIGVVGALFAIELFVWHWSIAQTTVANATLLANMATIFAAIYGFLLFGERINRRFIAGMILALVGAGVLIGQNVELNPAYLSGDMLGILTATFYAAYIVAAARARKHISLSLLMAGTALVSTALLAIPLAFTDDPVLPQSMEGWLPLVGLALIAQVLGQSLIVYGLAHVPATLGALSLLLQPVLSAVLAWWIFGEALGPLHLVGGSAVLAGIWVARSSKAAGSKN